MIAMIVYDRHYTTNPCKYLSDQPEDRSLIPSSMWRKRAIYKNWKLPDVVGFPNNRWMSWYARILADI